MWDRKKEANHAAKYESQKHSSSTFFNVSMFDHTKVWLKRLLLTKVQESLHFVLSQKNSVQISKVNNTMQWDSETVIQHSSGGSNMSHIKSLNVKIGGILMTVLWEGNDKSENLTWWRWPPPPVHSSSSQSISKVQNCRAYLTKCSWNIKDFSFAVYFLFPPKKISMINCGNINFKKLLAVMITCLGKAN